MKERMKRLVAFMLAALLLVASSGEVMPQVYAASGINRSESKTMRAKHHRAWRRRSLQEKPEAKRKRRMPRHHRVRKKPKVVRKPKTNRRQGKGLKIRKKAPMIQNRRLHQKRCIRKDKKTEKEEGTVQLQRMRVMGKPAQG